MSEASQTLNQKTAELEAVVEEAQQELSRADVSRRTEAHAKLAAVVREARGWLDERARTPGGGDAAAAARRAEGYLHEIQMLRGDI